MDRFPRIAGDLEAGEGAGVGPEPVVMFEKAVMIREDQSLLGRGAIERAIDGQFLELGLEQDGGLLEILASSPKPDGSGVTGPRRHSRAESAGNQQRVAIEPRGATLRFGQAKSVFDETLRGNVELAQHHRVAAATRQTQNGSIVGWRQRRGARPDPILAFRLGERVEIEQHLPTRIGFAVGREGRAAPKALRVGCVLPIVVDGAAAPCNAGNSVGPIEQGGQDVAIPGEALRAEPPQGFRRLRVDPLERARTVDVLEPEIGIVVGFGERGAGVDRHEAAFLSEGDSAQANGPPRRRWQYPPRVSASYRMGAIAAVQPDPTRRFVRFPASREKSREFRRANSRQPGASCCRPEVRRPLARSSNPA